MYNFIKTLCLYFFKTFFRFKVIGIENIPHTGGAVIAANHISLWDPPVVGAALQRPINFMAKEELFVGPLGWIIKIMKAFPVKRGAADRAAIRNAINLLKNGELLGLFPEGTRSKNGELGKPEAGIGMIVLKAGVPIIPTAIIGTNQVGKGCLLPQFVIKYGKPIYISNEKDSRESMENIGQIIMQEISCLLKER